MTFNEVNKCGGV